MGKTLAELNVKIGASAKALNDTLSATQKRLNKFSRTTGKLANSINQNITLPFVALGAVSLKNFDAQQKAIAKIETGLQSTGNAVGKTSKELQDLAAQLQSNSLYGDEDILENVTAPLLTFVKIQGDVFDEAQQNVLDYAAKLNIDLKSASIQVGKALNDPVKGINALSRAGVQFTEEQKDLIKSLVETGREADAQRIIMKELETQFGGTAKAVSMTGLGPVQQLKNQLGDLSESIGAILLPYVQQLAEKVTNLAKWFTGLSAETQNNIVKFTGLAAAMGVGLKVLSSVTGLASTMIGTMKALANSKLLAAAAQKALNFAMSANPIGLVISAIGLLIGALAVAYNKSERFRAVVHGIGAVAKEVFKVIKEAIGGFMDGFNALAEGDFRAAFKGFKEGLIKSNPLGVALTQGNRLGEAFKKGYADTISEPGALDVTEAITIPAVTVPVVPDFSGMGSGGSSADAGSSDAGGADAGADVMTEGMKQSVGTVSALSLALKDLSVSSDGVGSSLSKIPEMVPVELLTGLESVVLSLAGTFKQLALSSDASFGKMANAALSAAQKFVKAKIFEGVSAAVSSALTNVPFPFNIAAGATAGLAANALFNKAMGALKIPQFEKGGQYMGGLALVGEAGPELINFKQGGHVTNNDDLMSMMHSPRGSTEVKFGKITFDGRDLVLGYESGLNLLGRSRG